MYGFRGEAISALCKLSNLCIITCQHPPLGHCLEFNNDGSIRNHTRQTRTKGTTVIVGKLFYSLPVRLQQLLRNYKQEVAKCVHVIHKYVLSRKNCKFTATQYYPNGKHTTLVKTAVYNSFGGCIAGLYGSKFLMGLLDLDSADMNPKFRINGYISKLDHGRSSTDRQFLFLNSRPVEIPALNQLINSMFRQINPLLYPCFVLYITCNEKFDRNVTPDKLGVILSENELKQVCSELLERVYNSPATLVCTQVETKTLKSVSKRIQQEPKKVAVFNRDPKLTKKFIKGDSVIEWEPTTLKMTPKPNYKTSKCSFVDPIKLPKSDFLKMKIIGQFNNGFILTIKDDNLFIIDQHASDEKIQYEKLINKKFATQRLILALDLDLTAQQISLLEQQQQRIRDLGFGITKNTTWQLTHVPRMDDLVLGHEDLQEIIHKNKLSHLTRVKNWCASKACRSAIMIGDALKMTKMEEILQGLSELNQPWNCPHGRPTIRLLTSLINS